jgi:hypothetical protein
LASRSSVAFLSPLDLCERMQTVPLKPRLLSHSGLGPLVLGSVKVDGAFPPSLELQQIKAIGLPKYPYAYPCASISLLHYICIMHRRLQLTLPLLGL